MNPSFKKKVPSLIVRINIYIIDYHAILIAIIMLVHLQQNMYKTAFHFQVGSPHLKLIP
jgi:hypothetical protein